MNPQQRPDRRLDWGEIVKVLAVLAATAALSGVIIAVSYDLPPTSRQPMFPPGTVITIPPAPR